MLLSEAIASGDDEAERSNLEEAVPLEPRCTLRASTFAFELAATASALARAASADGVFSCVFVLLSGEGRLGVTCGFSVARRSRLARCSVAEVAAAGSLLGRR